MSNDPSPWGRDPVQPPPAPSHGRPWLWVVLALAIGALVLVLFRAFPEAVRRPEEWTDLFYAIGLLALVSAGLARARRTTIGRHLRHAAIWVGVVAVGAVIVSYREEFAGIPHHLRMAFGDGTPVATGERELVVPQNEDGAYVIVGGVNGQRVRFIVDTGATDTVLAPADARRLGVPVDQLDYAYESETANGVGRSAAYRGRIEVGPIVLDDFAMSINQASMTSSLLGLSFLNRLESFEFRGRKLILHWREPAA